MRRREFITLLGGAAATWPLAARAQQPAMPVIGYLSSRSAGESKSAVEIFSKGLAESGYTEGRNVAIEYRWANGEYDRLLQLATELVAHRVAVIFAPGGTDPAKAAKNATATIPIVFISAADPLTPGLVASLNRPGGNVTGVSLIGSTLEAKRLDILRQIVPQGAVIGALINPNYPAAHLQLDELREAAKAIGQPIEVVHATQEQDFEPAFATLLRAGARALLVATDVFLLSRREQLIELAARNALPAMYGFRENALSGGLMSYGASLANAYHQAAIYTGRILNGEKPADLPVLQPTKFEFIINLKTAKILGLEIPSMVLALADEVIE
jgi:putative ABC transport system substrate-binding protein